MSLRQNRLAVAGAFATQGFVFISLTTRLPAFSDHWSLSEVELSLLLLSGAAGRASAPCWPSGWPRACGSAALLRASLVGIAVAVPAATLAPDVAVFVAAVAGYGVALGVVDAAINMQAVALEHRYARPILPSFHGAWTLGGLVGSALTLATADLDLRWMALLAVVPLVAVAAPFLPHERAGAPSTDVAVPWRPIVLVGVALVLFYMVDTAAFTWGPTYLDHVVDAPSEPGRAGDVPLPAGERAGAAGRRRPGRRYGPVRVLRAGALVACFGLAVVVFAPTWPVAVLGFTLLGGGVAVIAPLSFSAAARIAGGDTPTRRDRRARVDAVIARFNQFNYVGALLGAVMTGARRRRLAARRVRRTDGAGARHPAAGEGVRAGARPGFRGWR